MLRLLVIAAFLLSAFVAPVGMASTLPQSSQGAEIAHVDGMADCLAPTDKKPMCKVDCALCHAVAPATAELGAVTVSYAMPTPAEPSAWTAWSPEMEPPIPRSVS